MWWALISCGLDAVKVWVKKPVLISYTNVSDMILKYEEQHKKFDVDVMRRGKNNYPVHLNDTGRWCVRHAGSTMEHHNTPFGKMFGYSDKDTENVESDECDKEISSVVWDEICSEFNYDEFDDWSKIDYADKAKHTTNSFMLKLTITHNGWVSYSFTLTE